MRRRSYLYITVGFECTVWFSAVPAPSGNPLIVEKVELGRHLFYDKLLPLPMSLACVDCHKQELAFTDGLSVSRGVNGEHGGRNSPTIANTGYQTAFFFDGKDSLPSAALAVKALASSCTYCVGQQLTL